MLSRVTVARAATARATLRSMPSVIGRATAADGTELRTRHWPATDPWASLLLVHGLGEHSGRYEHVGEQFSAAGIDTHAFDLRGQGASDGRRGDIDRWSHYHDDLAERLEAVRAAAGGRSVVLYGHSMGGLVVAGYLLSDRPKPDLVVLTAPALDSTLAAWKRTLAPLLGRILPTLAIPTGIDPETLSRDRSVGERVVVDDLCVKVSTTRFAAEALREQARVRAGARSIAIPTLVLHGRDDGLVPPEASEVFEGVSGMERRTYPGLRHELHNETEGPAILAEVVAWLRERARLSRQPNTASGERLER
jgi:alpha-beta hydrolase superfamily lysophospholipase